MLNRIWTISNVLSFSRILFTVPICLCVLASFPHHQEWASVIILVAVMTDFVDGYVARKLHQVTDLGKAIDPIADKIGVGAVGITVTALGLLPLWFIVTIVARDLLILAGGIYIRRTKNIVPQSNWPGKIAVTLIAVTILLSIQDRPELVTAVSIALGGSVAMMALSLIIYADRLFIGSRSIQQS
jgi:cardiolipin synthase